MERKNLHAHRPVIADVKCMQRRRLQAVADSWRNTTNPSGDRYLAAICVQTRPTRSSFDHEAVGRVEKITSARRTGPGRR